MESLQRQEHYEIIAFISNNVQRQPKVTITFLFLCIIISMKQRLGWGAGEGVGWGLKFCSSTLQKLILWADLPQTSHLKGCLK